MAISTFLGLHDSDRLFTLGINDYKQHWKVFRGWVDLSLIAILSKKSKYCPLSKSAYSEVKLPALKGGAFCCIFVKVSCHIIYLPADQVYCRLVLVMISFPAFHFCTIITVSFNIIQFWKLSQHRKIWVDHEDLIFYLNPRFFILQKRVL